MRLSQSMPHDWLWPKERLFLNFPGGNCKTIVEALLYSHKEYNVFNP